MSCYAENASRNRHDIFLIRQEIDAYKAAHPGEPADKELIDAKIELVTTEIKLSNDYNAMFHREGVDTHDSLVRLQRKLQEDITSLQNDLMESRKIYKEENKKEMDEKYQEPLDFQSKIDKAVDMAEYQKWLFENIRLILLMQNKKISFCKNMDDYEYTNAKELQTKLRKQYSDSFDRLFEHTETSVKKLGMNEGTKHILEIRKDLIEQGQRDYSTKGGRLIIEKPPKLKAICDKANTVRSYKKELDSDIERYQFMIEMEKEYAKEQEEYYKPGGKYEQDMAEAEREEAARYDEGWVIPDEGYKDPEGNIVYKEKDDEREI